MTIRRAILFFIFLLLLPTPALSDMSVSSYQSNINKQTKRGMTFFYLEAVGTGITWTNSLLLSKTNYSLFCPPVKLSLKGELAVKLLNRHLRSPEGKQLRSDDSVSFALLSALIYAYPCQ